MTQDQLELYFETYADLFLTPGWKQFQEEIANNIRVTENIRPLSDSKALHIAQGKVAAFEFIASFEDQVNLAQEETHEETA